MATEHGNEKVLFELRVNADGSTTITTSAEWDAYHTGRWGHASRPSHAGRWGRRWRSVKGVPHRTMHDLRANAHDMRATLHSLENIYNDLYAESSG